MNKRILYSVFMVMLVSAITCKKPDDGIIKDQKSIYYNEQAFPHNNGEIEDFIFGNDTITCEIINNHYVFQGDMILTKDQIKLLESGKGTGIEAFIYKWSNNTIFYLIDERIKNRSIITDAIKHWEENSPLRFPYYPDWIKAHPDYQFGIPLNTLSFEYSEDGCYSYIGMVGNNYNNSGNIVMQEIGLADWADKGTVIHEIAHTLGLMHEHSRSDRDQYIRINLENVEAGKENNFDKMNTPYATSDFDFNSIMMYSAYAFSKNGSPTITKTDGSVYDAQREALSEGDKEIINLIYRYPEVINLRLKDITDKSATCEYRVTSYQGLTITETGIFWGTEENPEQTGTKKIIGTNTGNNTAVLTDLSPNTTYFIRAYVVNGEGPYYSDQVTFSTLAVKGIDSNW